MGMRDRSAGRIMLGGQGHQPTGHPRDAARPASATSPRTATGTACCSTRRCGRTACSATRPQRPTSRGVWIDAAGAKADTERIVARVRRPHARIDVLAASLSGGNQQKLIVGREMSHDPKVLIAAHPTRGVDVGAQAAIWDQIREARARAWPCC